VEIIAGILIVSTIVAIGIGIAFGVEPKLWENPTLGAIFLGSLSAAGISGFLIVAILGILPAL